MIHKLKLQPTFYNFIQIGTKRIELRLYDEKRKNIKIGDTITFYKLPDLKENFQCNVKDLIFSNSFKDLIENLDIEQIADKNFTKNQVLDALNSFYTKEQQDEFGVVGIVLELK